MNIKIIFTFLFILIFSFAFTQNKKEQIQLLNARLDSLKTIQSTEKKSFEIGKNDYETSITKSNHKTTELLITLENKKENLDKQIQENRKLYQEISSFQHQLKSIEDSIQAIIDNQPIMLLDKLDNKNNEELIEFFNISVLDVQHDGCNSFEKFSILGKQNFICGKDTFCCIVMGALCKEKIHPASGTNFIGLFRFSNGNYIKLINIEAKGSFGFGSCANLEGFKIIGRKNLCVILNNGYYGSGQSIEDRIFYSVDKSKIELMKIGTGEEGIGKKHEYFGGGNNNNFEGFIEWKIKFIESEKEFFDLELVEKESNKSKLKTTTFKFNEKNLKYE